MSNIIRLCFVIYIVPLVLCGNEVTEPTLVNPDDSDYDDDFQPSTVDYDRFDWILTKLVATSTDENFLLSPLGLKLSLAILAEAATGTTQEEISNVLNFEANRTAVRTKFASVIQSLEVKTPRYELDLGNRIYLDDRAHPSQRFAAVAEKFYSTELKKLDFDAPALAVKEINSWVANKTDRHILSLVKEDDIIGSLILILNTLYFKGTWLHQFPLNDTKLDAFYVAPKIQRQVPFMSVEDKFYYKESTNCDAKILRMPYLGKKFAMYIVVPNAFTDLSSTLNHWSGLREELNSLQEHQVKVKLPKFQFDYTVQLNDMLNELGIRQAFEDTASFPGLTRGRGTMQRLKVSKVLQRSGIEVNELGSIAYEATETSLDNKFGDENFEVVADKPFLFFIQDEATRQLLFTGRVSDPALFDGANKLV